MRRVISGLAACVAMGAMPAYAQRPPAVSAVRLDLYDRVFTREYQGAISPGQTEHFSRKVKLGRDGRIAIANFAGNISVTVGGGDEVSIDAVKRGRPADLQQAEITVSEGPGRVDIQAGSSSRRVSVDFTVVVPASAAVDLRSVSGDISVTGVRGAVRAEAINGTVTTAGTPRLEVAKTVSGDLAVTDAGSDGDVSLGSVSGGVSVKGLKARGLDLQTVSGDTTLANIRCDRVGIRSVSGGVAFSGTLAKSGRYDITAHSGDISLTLDGGTGFDVEASSFSGSIHSALPVTPRGPGPAPVGAGRPKGPASNRLVGTYGDASAQLTLRSFSGDITIQKP